MLSNKQIKLINLLHSKKGRKENPYFLVEGAKGIEEVLASDFQVDGLILAHSVPEIQTKVPVFRYAEADIQKLSSLSTNTYGLALVQQKPLDRFPLFEKETWVPVLDGVRDPGNLGSILRICDWYGFHSLVLSEDSTEFYNPKVIAASMGSFTRVKVFYQDLERLFSEYPKQAKLGAVLHGENLHQFNFPEAGFLIMGNESQGIRPTIQAHLSHQVGIPKFGGAESLNVGVSTAILLDHLRQRCLP